MSQAELALEACRRLLDAVYRKTESLTSMGIEGSGGGLEIKSYGKDR